MHKPISTEIEYDKIINSKITGKKKNYKNKIFFKIMSSTNTMKADKINLIMS